MTAELNRARRLLADAETVVSFSGAGLSAESGIATFRDPDGVWKKIDPTVYASAQGFRAHPTKVIEWYADRRRTLASTTPNAAHFALAQTSWHAHVTQNVDNLLERAGADNIIHLHGTLDSDRCDASCGFSRKVDLTDPPGEGTCPTCGAALRPSVVWFGEMLPSPAWAAAESAIRSADVVVVIGTSGEVWPAASLIDEASAVITVNTQPSGAGRRSAVELIGPAGTIVPRLVSADDPNTQ